jgi:hypothetical protein
MRAVEELAVRLGLEIAPRILSDSKNTVVHP